MGARRIGEIAGGLLLISTLIFGIRYQFVKADRMQSQHYAPALLAKATSIACIELYYGHPVIADAKQAAAAQKAITHAQRNGPAEYPWEQSAALRYVQLETGPHARFGFQMDDNIVATLGWPASFREEVAKLLPGYVVAQASTSMPAFWTCKDLDDRRNKKPSPEGRLE